MTTHTLITIENLEVIPVSQVTNQDGFICPITSRLPLSVLADFILEKWKGDIDLMIRKVGAKYQLWTKKISYQFMPAGSKIDHRYQGPGRIYMLTN